METAPVCRPGPSSTLTGPRLPKSSLNPLHPRWRLPLHTSRDERPSQGRRQPATAPAHVLGLWSSTPHLVNCHCCRDLEAPRACCKAYLLLRTPSEAVSPHLGHCSSPAHSGPTMAGVSPDLEEKLQELEKELEVRRPKNPMTRPFGHEVHSLTYDRMSRRATLHRKGRRFRYRDSQPLDAGATYCLASHC